MNSRRRRSKTESFCDVQNEVGRSGAQRRKSRSRSHGDLHENNISQQYNQETLECEDVQSGRPNGNKPDCLDVESALVYGKKIIQGEGLYEGFLTYDGLRTGKGCMKGFDTPSSSSYRTILKGGAKKNLKYQYEGSWDNDHPHGFGVYRYFESGDRYEGNFIEGKRHGLGIFLWGNGDKYTGNFENGMMSGLGRFEWAHGDIYHGMWKMGKVMGDGIMIAADGSQSQGSFQDGLLHGWAKKIWSHGDIYFGYFKHDAMSNYGTYQWKDGHRYEGAWKENKTHGIGQYLTASKILPNVFEYTTFFGDYHCGLQNGLGRVEVQDSGSFYIGEVIELKEHSYNQNDSERRVWGHITYENGIVYEGDCIDCTRDGYGLLSCSKITETIEDSLNSQIISEDDFKRFAATLQEQYMMMVALPPLDFANLGAEREVEDILLEMGGRYYGYFKEDTPHGKGVFELCNGQRHEVVYNFGILLK